MKTLLFLILGLFALTAHAFPINREFQDMKLPTQKMIESQTFTNPAEASATAISSGIAGPTSAAAATVTSFSAQPDLARNLTITPTGTTGDVESCVVTVTGTDYGSNIISETFTFLANASTAQNGNKAFKTISSVSFPANCESGSFAATWNIGVGEKLGIKRCMGNTGDVVFSLLNGYKEATGPTMTVDSDELPLNTADFNGTMNGSNDFVLYFFQNFGCH